MTDLNDLERIERLERLLADLAEDVGTGRANTTRRLDQNKALAVLRELRPDVAPPSGAVPASEICGRLQDKDNPDESFVCIERAGHTSGHRYATKPKG